MTIICAWCKKDMGQKPPLEKEVVTHGICEDCHTVIVNRREMTWRKE